jgi:site-specific recombinase XerD
MLQHHLVSGSAESAVAHVNWPQRSPSREVNMLKLVNTPRLTHPYQVANEDGLPDVRLSLFASDLMQSLSPASVPIYMRELIALFNWALSDTAVQRNNWSLFGATVAVRNLIREYLIRAAQCNLTYRDDRTGLKVSYVSVSDGTRINVRILLAALRRFYDYLIESKEYEAPNPMLVPEAGRVMQELRAQYRRAINATEGRDPMPALSGVDPPSGIRLSANFFRCINREWVPKTIDDPYFPNLVINAGKEYGWSLREQCIARTMFEGGGRISEVLDLTALDWSTSNFLNRFEARNKGSRGIRTKHFVVSSATAKLVRRYFDDDIDGRRAHDPSRLSVADLEKMNSAELAKVQVFLTTRSNKPLTQKVFRTAYWTPALRAAGISAQPHQSRHWFVTNALRTIERTSKNEAEVIRRKAELIEYMAWSTGERTLKAYEHVVRGGDFIEKTLNHIHKEMRKREHQSTKDPTLLTRFVPLPPAGIASLSDEEVSLLKGVLA